MSAAKFSAGQSVRFQAPSITRKHGQDRYSVIRVMPLVGEEYEYRIKSPAELYERVVRESLLTLIRDEGASGRDVGPPRTLGGVPSHKQTPRSVATLLNAAGKKQSPPRQPRTEPVMETDEAAWLDNWCAQKMIAAPDTGDAGVQTLIHECEAAARTDGVLLQRALKAAGYAKLQVYFLDAFDDRAESEAAGRKDDGDGGVNRTGFPGGCLV